MSKPYKKSLGFVVAVMALSLSLFTSHGWGAAPDAPVMTVTTSGLDVTVSWSTVTGATGYTLLYAPYPSADPISSMDMGSQTSLSVTLSEGAAYYLAIKAYNATESSGYSNIEYFTLTTTTTGGSTVTDVEGNVYNTVTIGTQVWMRENLKVTKYRNGEAIGTTVTATTNISGVTSPKYQWAYNGNEANVSTYGRLYTWSAATDSRGLCPTGWHVPTDTEWTTLTDYLGGSTVAGGKMKESGTTHWFSPNTGADNSSGFTALPIGYRSNYGSFYELGNYGYWWSATEGSATSAWGRGLGYGCGDASRGSGSKDYGFNVRCVRD